MEKHQLVNPFLQLVDIPVKGLFGSPLNISVLVIDSRILLLFEIKGKIPAGHFFIFE
jgi:hypothetical protein